VSIQQSYRFARMFELLRQGQQASITSDRLQALRSTDPAVSARAFRDLAVQSLLDPRPGDATGPSALSLPPRRTVFRRTALAR
jgi:hypothetical protein